MIYRKSKTLLVAFFLIFGLSACEVETTGEAEVTTSKTEEVIDYDAEIGAVRTAFENAFASGDASRMAALYTSDARMYVADGSVFSGGMGVQEGFQGVMDQGMTSVSVEPDETVPVGDGLVWETGRYTYRGQGPNGATMEAGGNYVVLVERTREGWKLRRSVGYALQQAPAAPAAPAQTPAPTDGAAARDTI